VRQPVVIAMRTFDEVLRDRTGCPHRLKLVAIAAGLELAYCTQCDGVWLSNIEKASWQRVRP